MASSSVVTGPTLPTREPGPVRFDRPSVAAGYASARPPVHHRVVALAEERIGPLAGPGIAIDVGCGAGASTAPLAERGLRCVGVDPSAAMVGALRGRGRGRAGAGGGISAVVGAAEALPFADGSVDVVGAAGSFEFADVARAADEAARVLVPGGVLLVYDFATGRPRVGPPDVVVESSEVGVESTTIRRDVGDDWFEGELLARWPRPVGPRRSTVTAAAVVRAGFECVVHERFVIEVAMERSAYAAYLLTESFVVHAVDRGEDPARISTWIERTVPWPAEPEAAPVALAGYLLTARRAG